MIKLCLLILKFKNKLVHTPLSFAQKIISLIKNNSDYLHLEGFCDVNKPINPVTPKKNPVQTPVPISAICSSRSDLRSPSNMICVIMAITAHAS